MQKDLNYVVTSEQRLARSEGAMWVSQRKVFQKEETERASILKWECSVFEEQQGAQLVGVE